MAAVAAVVALVVSGCSPAPAPQPVEVTGSSVQLSSADNDYYDWSIPWEKWVGLSAV